MSRDHYLTLGGPSMGEVREKASRFIAHAFPIKDEADFQQQQAAIAQKHHSARHICHAWVLGADGGRFRAFDAGEPAGSAGKPILRQLQGAGLTYCAIVVVRYFGGTLLGKAGLSHAFAAAAKEALAAGSIVERTIFSALRVQCTYAQVEAIKRDVARHGGDVRDASYAEQCLLDVAVPLSQAEPLLDLWKRQQLAVSRLD